MRSKGTELLLDMMFKGYKPTTEEHRLIVRETCAELYIVDPEGIENELHTPEYDKKGVLIAWNGGNTYKRGYNNPNAAAFGDTTNYYRKKSTRVAKNNYPMTTQVWVKPKHLKS